MRPTNARRNFLRSAGVSIALPSLASLANRVSASETRIPEATPRRMVCVGNMLGFYPKAFWPQRTQPATSELSKDGSAKSSPSLSQTLQSLKPHQGDLTVIGGLDHGLKGGHFAIHGFLSGVHHNESKSMPDGNISLDQFAAERMLGRTRFSSLTVGSDSGIHGGCRMSWTRAGTRVPPITGPKELFETLFVGVAQADRREAADRFQLKASILDAVTGDARAVSKRLNARDKQKLEEYLTSIREVEVRLSNSKRWIDIEKPAAPFERPKNTNMVDDLPLLYDLIAIALQTDSTRIATLEIGGDFEAREFGYRSGYHGLSHHGQRPEAIDALIKIESYQVQQFSRFLTKLRETDSGESNLLEHTTVLFGSGMGDANKHTNSELPIVLAGGGFRHAGQLWFDRKDPHRPPLTNLYVSILQQLGIETDRFATSTGTLRGLESLA